MDKLNILCNYSQLTFMAFRKIVIRRDILENIGDIKFFKKIGVV